VDIEPPEYQWRKIFMAALTDMNSGKFADRLAAADDAVFKRLFELEGKAGTDVERLALENTMQDLRMLREKSDQFRV
jgi:hypothetical protein